ncbi:hypothetical protein [Parashewanella tropica]|uniref:hypothetical protein n=1 Tax=Parashewanella tropica TaxID=2547970 RepID=UPI00105A3DC0|nr:hypothetical protein [Parashewanella tropica]
MASPPASITACPQASSAKVFWNEGAPKTESGYPSISGLESIGLALCEQKMLEIEIVDVNDSSATRTVYFNVQRKDNNRYRLFFDEPRYDCDPIAQAASHVAGAYNYWQQILEENTEKAHDFTLEKYTVIATCVPLPSIKEASHNAIPYQIKYIPKEPQQSQSPTQSISCSLTLLSLSRSHQSTVELLFDSHSTIEHARAHYLTLSETIRAQFNIMWFPETGMLVGLSNLIKIVLKKPNLKMVKVDLNPSEDGPPEQELYFLVEKDNDFLKLIPFKSDDDPSDTKNHSIENLICIGFTKLQCESTTKSFEDKVIDTTMEVLAFYVSKQEKFQFHHVPVSSLTLYPQETFSASVLPEPEMLTFTQAHTLVINTQNPLLEKQYRPTKEKEASLSHFLKQKIKKSNEIEAITPANIDLELVKFIDIPRQRYVIIAHHVELIEEELETYFKETQAQFRAYSPLVQKQLLIIPIALKRPSLTSERSKHAVFCIISKAGVVLIDSKRVSPIYSKKIRVIRTKWQGPFDVVRCTKYVTFGISKLVTFINRNPIDWDSMSAEDQYKLLKLIFTKQIPRPSGELLASLFEDVEMSDPKHDEAEFEHLLLSPDSEPSSEESSTTTENTLGSSEESSSTTENTLNSSKLASTTVFKGKRITQSLSGKDDFVMVTIES